MPAVNGFAPVVGSCPTILVLGTMPGVKSLAQQQYYAHSRNAFWWVMEQVFGVPRHLPYERRLELMCERGLALWDVLAACHREGSLDSSIERAGSVANDIPALLATHSSISVIALNGQAASTLLKRHHGRVFDQIDCRVLPSTSPANARMTREEKLTQWRRALQPACD